MLRAPSLLLLRPRQLLPDPVQLHLRAVAGLPRALQLLQSRVRLEARYVGAGGQTRQELGLEP